MMENGKLKTWCVLFNYYIAVAIYEQNNEYVILMKYCYQGETNVLGITRGSANLSSTNPTLTGFGLKKAFHN
jgi:hypothetical protein